MLILHFITLFDIVRNFAEGSGQNFMDDDFDKNSSCKKKRASVDTTDQEQVMFINFH